MPEFVRQRPILTFNLFGFSVLALLWIVVVLDYWAGKQLVPALLVLFGIPLLISAIIKALKVARNVAGRLINAAYRHSAT